MESTSTNNASNESLRNLAVDLWLRQRTAPFLSQTQRVPDPEGARRALGDSVRTNL